MPQLTLFLSTVTKDFDATVRDYCSSEIASSKVAIKTQEILKSSGETTRTLADTVEQTDAVMHLIGAEPGAFVPNEGIEAVFTKHPDLPTLAPWLAELLKAPDAAITYTQLEAYLALFYKKQVICFAPKSFLDAVRKDEGDPSQRAHLARLRARNMCPSSFETTDQLLAQLAVRTLQLFTGAGLPVPRAIDLSKLPETYARHLYGRDREMADLETAWNGGRTRIFALDAMGGAGKTALTYHFVQRLKDRDWGGAERVYAWSFYSQGSNEDRQTSADEFFAAAFRFFSGGTEGPPKEAREKGERLAALVKAHRTLLILDGLEPLQYAAGSRGGDPKKNTTQVGGIKDPGIKALIEILADAERGLVIITTRIELAELKANPSVVFEALEALPLLDGIALIRDLGVEPAYPPASFKLAPRDAVAALLKPDGTTVTPPADYDPPAGDDRAPMPAQVSRDLAEAVAELKGHALALTLVGNYLATHKGGDIRELHDLPSLAEMDPEDKTRSPYRVMRAIEIALVRRIAEDDPKLENPAGTAAGRQLALLFFLGFFDRPIERTLLDVVFEGKGAPEPEAGDLAKAAKDDLDLYEKLEALAARERTEELPSAGRQRIERERAEIKAALAEIYEARHRVVVRRLFAGMAAWLCETKITDALSQLAKQGLVARPTKGEAWTSAPIDCHPLVREYFGARLGGDFSGKGALDLATFQAGHGRLYDWYRYDGLPEEFRTSEAYALLAYKSSFPDGDLEGRADQAAAGALTPESAPTLPPTFWTSDPERMRAAARLIDGPQWQDALTAFRPEGEAGMTPLFSAIAHGCKAGRQAEAWAEVYRPRITRGNEGFASKKLGLYGQELAAIAAFFDEAFTIRSNQLTPGDRALALNSAAFRLRALGRLEDAAAPMRAAIEGSVAIGDWVGAATDAGNLTELLLTLGRVEEAVMAGGQAQAYADRSGDAFMRMLARASNHALALLAAGDLATAEALFRAAEVLQKANQPEIPQLYSTAGAHYADLLIARGRAAEAGERAARNLPMARRRELLLDIALDTLTQARTELAAAGASAHPASSSASPAKARQRAEPGPLPLSAEKTPDLRGPASPPVRSSGEATEASGAAAAATAVTPLTAAALAALRRANQEQFLPSGLLAHAEALWRSGKLDEAGRYLKELDTIATRGPMPLFAAEARMLAARMALSGGRVAQARKRYGEAAALIARHAWARALPELAVLDAEIAIADDSPDAADKLTAAVIAVRGTPPRPVGGTGVPEVDDAGLMIDGGWWGLLPRLLPLLPEADPRRAELLAAEAAYNAERDAWLAKQEAELAAEWAAEDAALADPEFRAELSSALVGAGYKPLDETPVSEQRNDARQFLKIKRDAEAKARGHIEADDVPDADVDAALADPQMREAMTALLKHSDIDQPLDALPRATIKAVIAALHNMAKDREQQQATAPEPTPEPEPTPRTSWLERINPFRRKHRGKPPGHPRTKAQPVRIATNDP